MPRLRITGALSPLSLFPRGTPRDIYYYYYYYYYVVVVVVVVFSCHRPLFPGTPLEPAVIATVQVSNFRLQYFPYYV
jgi:hypothetical protein